CEKIVTGEIRTNKSGFRSSAVLAALRSFRSTAVLAAVRSTGARGKRGASREFALQVAQRFSLRDQSPALYGHFRYLWRRSARGAFPWFRGSTSKPVFRWRRQWSYPRGLLSARS